MNTAGVDSSTSTTGTDSPRTISSKWVTVAMPRNAAPFSSVTTIPTTQSRTFGAIARILASRARRSSGDRMESSARRARPPRQAAAMHASSRAPVSRFTSMAPVARIGQLPREGSLS